MRTRVLALAAVAVLAVAACSAEDTAEGDGGASGDRGDRGDRGSSSEWQSIPELAEARAAGATDEQLAVLAEAHETGEVSFAAYREAVDRSMRCLREAGADFIDHGVVEIQGLERRSYSISAESEEADRHEPAPGVPVHRCIAEHSFWVEQAYQMQPSSVEAQEAHFERYRDAIVECMSEHGLEVEPDLGLMELRSQARAEEQLDIYGICLEGSGFHD